MEETNEEADKKDDEDHKLLKRITDLGLDHLLKKIADLEKDADITKSSVGDRGDELDKEKYKKLVTEYRKFKTSNIKHFRLNPEANTSAFGES